MFKKFLFLITIVIVLSLAAPANADELLASYEDSEYPDLLISTDAGKDPTLTVTRVPGGVGDAPPATDGTKVLMWVWTDETQGSNPYKIEIRHDWAVRRLDLAPYNLITADVWFDEASAQPATIGIWDDVFAWAGALSVPTGTAQWHTVEMDISGVDANDIDHIFAFLFEDLAGDAGTIYTDNMWLVYRPQWQAWQPIPFDNAVSIDPNEDLVWDVGVDANSHDVYFGSSWSEVNDANNSLPVGTSVYKGNQALGNTSYDPNTLDWDTTYYWRIDEVNEADPNVWKGDIWSFTTDPYLGYVEILLCSYEDSETHYEVWKGITIAGDADDSLILNDKLAGGSTWDPPGPDPPVSVPAASDGSNVLGLAWGNESDLEVEHGCTFEGSDFTYDLYGIDEMVFDIYYAPNDFHGGFNPLPHSIFVFDWRFTPSANPSSNLPTTRGEWHTIVIDVSHLNNVGLDSIYDFAFAAHGEDFDPNGADPDNHGALVFMDNLRLRFVATPYATLPRPGHGATEVSRNTDLEWREGTEASSHGVYFGTDFNDVNDANTADPEYKGSQVLANTAYDVNLLDPNQTYYWRIDEANGPNTWIGEVWSFTTAESSIVDNFKLYLSDNQLDAVWSKISGASNVDVSLSSTVARGDGNSMKVIYDNNTPGPPADTYTEFGANTSDLQAGTNWSLGDTKALVLYFYGSVGNDLNEPLYVALDDGTNFAVKYYDGDMNNLDKPWWQQWNIDLEDFNDISNVDLTAVLNISIGFGIRGNTAMRPGDASGTVYIDDIELWPSRCVAARSLPEGDFTGDCLVDEDDLEILAHDWLIGDYNVVAAAQNDANLVAWYKFENNFLDSSGNGNTGTPHGGIDFVAGANGLAIDLDGFGDYVSISDSNTPGGVFDINDVITLAAWIKVTTFDLSYQTIIARGDDSWRLARYQETGKLEFAASGLSGGAQPPFGNVIGTTRVNVDDGQWHHVAGVYDGSKVYLYIDGVLDSVEDASGIIDDSTYEVYIGENAENSDREWEGVIDEVRIYHEALPHAEIVSLAGQSEVYQPVLSLANIYDEESKFSKKINFKDYAVMADRWLKELLFPFE